MPGRPRSATISAGARIGRVTALAEDGPLVEVPTLRTGYSYGPAAVVEGLARLSTDPAGTDGHQHPHGRPLDVGDAVLVLFLGDSRTELVVVDRLLPAGPQLGP